MSADIETDVLIVGTGPAGASMAALLSTYGISNMVINRFAWTARTPRAHITNQRTMEIIRDLGLEEEALALATPHELMGENTYCESLSGEEFGRIQTWGTDPARRGDYERASPTMICDLPQNLLEPMFIRAAAHRGSKVRFDTEYISHTQDDDGVTSKLKDRLSGHTIEVRSKYLIGADGANSRIVDQLGLPLEGEMGKSGSINLVFEADLTRYVAHRPSVLYWIIQPGSHVGGLGIGVVRMVRPWNKWLAIWGYDVDQGPPDIDEAFAKSIIHNLIGDDSVDVKVQSTSTWQVNETYATRLSKGRVFCMGDAVHRHPPTNGLGSNTSIQDAHNLAWKIAFVLKGAAGPDLLESYDAERAPVAEQVVKRANKSLEDFPPILQALGILDAETPDAMKTNMAARKKTGKDATAQREALARAVAGSQYVYNAHGVEMNMRYASNAISDDGSSDPGFTRDGELYHAFSSRPGAPLPHCRLIDRKGRKISTLDLAGQGRFTLLTGVSGKDSWSKAAQVASDALDIAIAVHAIGPGQAFEDPYGDWMSRRETAEDGALLVRPDNIVAYRAKTADGASGSGILDALNRILARADKKDRIAAE
ncbi:MULTISPECIES: FAD-dependent oxidoreductase [Henriciella]|uniref:FAD-dependent oxidoreductase n=1 Tax=Henriciella TaxID=453849 RepID=UPI00351742CA